MRPYHLFLPLLVFVIAIAQTPLGFAKLRKDLTGDPAELNRATRTIVIRPDTKYVNVTGGEIIKFVVDGKAFAWNFNSMNEIPPFELTLIAPSEVAINHKVLVYVATNPLYKRHRDITWSPWSS
jgi:hypothetical protein